MTATISDQSYSLHSPTGSMLNLRLEQSRRHIEANRESTVFVEVEISPDQSTQIAQKNHHICLVIDCSGSMNEDMKIEQAKNAAIKLVRGLPSTDTVSIVAFDDDVHVILDPKPASERQYIENMIHSITTGTATAMHAGISKGFDLVQQSHTLSSSNTINRLVVITDGLPNVPLGISDEDFIEQAKEIRKSGITISTMGIGDDYGEQLLKSISEFGGGSWDHIGNDGDLSKVVNDQATQMQQTIVTNPQLRITLMDTAELLEANASKPKVMPIDDLKTTGNVTIIGLKDIIRNEPHALHFKIKVNASDGENIPFLTAEILEGSNVVAGPDTIEISYTNDRKLYNVENKSVFFSFLSTESILCNAKTIATGDLDAKKRSDTIVNILPHPDTVEGLAHDTIVHANTIHGKTVPDLTESEKKKLLHHTTVMEDTMTEKLDEAINDLKNSEEDEKE